MTTNLRANEYNTFYQPYIDALFDNNLDIVENLKFSKVASLDLLKDLNQEKHEYSYAEGKWTIKEIIQHIIDAERVFNYRALRIARGDKTDLLGFDENKFVVNSQSKIRNYNVLLEEFISLRKTTIFLYESFATDTLVNLGTVAGNPMSVRAIGFITSGHLLHHLNVIKDRYL